MNNFEKELESLKEEARDSINESIEVLKNKYERYKDYEINVDIDIYWNEWDEWAKSSKEVKVETPSEPEPIDVNASVEKALSQLGPQDVFILPEQFYEECSNELKLKLGALQMEKRIIYFKKGVLYNASLLSTGHAGAFSGF